MSLLNNLVFCIVIFQFASGMIEAVGVCDQVEERSCLDYLKKGSTEDGYYNIYNENDDSSESVYCDMVPEVGAAWTLVESFARANKDEDPFKKYAFQTNAPVDEKSPNFKRYRMSQPQMASLKCSSTHWRATCNFLTSPIDGRDQMRGKFQDFDIMKAIGDTACKPVEYVNIRGHECSKCTARFWSSLNGYHQHIDSSAADCEFRPNAGSVGSEDNFGFSQNINTNFRCMENQDSTTNWWFGGYLCDKCTN